jgi:peptidoglycan/xylan/chitin deacetylase (PgdA/CDA1 family)
VEVFLVCWAVVRWFLIVWNVVAIPAWVWLWQAGHFWTGAGFVFSGHAAALLATLYPYCDWWGPQRGDFATQNREVWLTIDDGPDPVDTPMILDALSRHGARATFFVIGEKARRHPALVHEIVRRGHAVGNHSLTHPHMSFWRLGPRRLDREVGECSAAVEELTGKRPGFFRAPTGMRNCFLHPVLRRRVLELVCWTVRGLDGRDTDPAAIVGRIRRGVRPGAIILMHESHRTIEGESVAARCIPRVLAELTAEGYRFVIPDLTRKS